MKHGLYTGRPDNNAGRPICCSAPKRACTSYAEENFNVNCWFFVVFSRLDSVGQLLSAHETRNQYPLLTQSCLTNAPVGWLPVGHHLLVLLQRPQQQQHKQQQRVLLQHKVLLQFTLLQHSLSSKDNASTRVDILAAASHATAATAVLIPVSTSTHMKRCCNVRSEDVPYLGLLHEVAPALPSPGRTRARTSCCLRHRDGKECLLYTHNGTKALIRH